MALWVHKGGRQGEREQRMLDRSVLGVGWHELDQDLGKLKAREELDQALRRAYPDASKSTVSNYLGQLFAFAQTAEKGDLVVVPLKTRSTIAIGELSGPYQFSRDLGEDMRHLRPVKWLKTDLPRTTFGQDLLYSFGAFMTFCQVKRNDAEARVRAILKTGADPASLNGKAGRDGGEAKTDAIEAEAQGTFRDLEQTAQDQIRAFIESNFKGHKMATLVDAILRAQGFVTRVSPPGPDGGTDILAGSGAMGFASPRICVQVKSSSAPCDVTVLRGLKGTMGDFKADQGLLVSWGGFKDTVLKESAQSFFHVRLWDSGELIRALLKSYETLDEDVQAQLPLKRLWTLAVGDES